MNPTLADLCPVREAGENGTMTCVMLMDVVKPERGHTGYNARTSSLTAFRVMPKEHAQPTFRRGDDGTTYLLPDWWFALAEPMVKATRMFPLPQMVAWDAKRLIVKGQTNVLSRAPCTGGLPDNVSGYRSAGKDATSMEVYMLLTELSRCNRATPEGFGNGANYPDLEGCKKILAKMSVAVAARFPTPLPNDEEEIRVRQMFAVNVAAGFPWVKTIGMSSDNVDYMRIGADGWFAPTQTEWVDYRTTVAQLPKTPPPSMEKKRQSAWVYSQTARLPYAPSNEEAPRLKFETEDGALPQFARECHHCGHKRLFPLRTVGMGLAALMKGRTLLEVLVMGTITTNPQSTILANTNAEMLMSPGLSMCHACGKLNTHRFPCYEYVWVPSLTLTLKDAGERSMQVDVSVRTAGNVAIVLAVGAQGEQWPVMVALLEGKKKEVQEEGASRLRAVDWLRRDLSYTTQQLIAFGVPPKRRVTTWPLGQWQPMYSAANLVTTFTGRIPLTFSNNTEGAAFVKPLSERMTYERTSSPLLMTAAGTAIREMTSYAPEIPINRFPPEVRALTQQWLEKAKSTATAFRLVLTGEWTLKEAT